jgi:hypothetical protein
MHPLSAQAPPEAPPAHNINQVEAQRATQQGPLNQQLSLSRVQLDKSSQFPSLLPLPVVSLGMAQSAFSQMISRTQQQFQTQPCFIRVPSPLQNPSDTLQSSRKLKSLISASSMSPDERRLALSLLDSVVAEQTIFVLNQVLRRPPQMVSDQLTVLEEGRASMSQNTSLSGRSVVPCERGSSSNSHSSSRDTEDSENLPRTKPPKKRNHSALSTEEHRPLASLLLSNDENASKPSTARRRGGSHGMETERKEIRSAKDDKTKVSLTYEVYCKIASGEVSTTQLTEAARIWYHKSCRRIGKCINLCYGRDVDKFVGTYHSHQHPKHPNMRQNEDEASNSGEVVQVESKSTSDTESSDAARRHCIRLAPTSFRCIQCDHRVDTTFNCGKV